MQPRRKENFKKRKDEYEDNVPIEDLLLKQRKGKFITHNEKIRIKKYAEERRKEKALQNKKKH